MVGNKDIIVRVRGKKVKQRDGSVVEYQYATIPYDSGFKTGDFVEIVPVEVKDD